MKPFGAGIMLGSSMMALFDLERGDWRGFAFGGLAGVVFGLFLIWMAILDLNQRKD